MAKLTKAQRQTLRDMFGGLCAYCGKPLGDRWHADHLEPVLRGYAEKSTSNPHGIQHQHRDTIENMMPACAPCNLDKTSFSLEQWRAKLEKSCASLLRYSSTYRHALRFGLVADTGIKVTFHFERIAHINRPLTRCAAGQDGECGAGQCPQHRDNEPHKSGRSCPLYVTPEYD